MSIHMLLTESSEQEKKVNERLKMMSRDQVVMGRSGGEYRDRLTIEQLQSLSMEYALPILFIYQERVFVKTLEADLLLWNEEKPFLEVNFEYLNNHFSRPETLNKRDLFMNELVKKKYVEQWTLLKHRFPLLREDFEKCGAGENNVNDNDDDIDGNDFANGREKAFSAKVNRRLLNKLHFEIEILEFALSRFNAEEIVKMFGWDHPVEESKVISLPNIDDRNYSIEMSKPLRWFLQKLQDHDHEQEQTHQQNIAVIVESEHGIFSYVPKKQQPIPRMYIVERETPTTIPPSES